MYVCVVVPAEQRLQAVQAAVILLPDENREVLQTLLYFLSDIASAQENQMTAESLAVCLAPSILHLNASKKDGASPRCVSHFASMAGSLKKSVNRIITEWNQRLQPVFPKQLIVTAFKMSSNLSQNSFFVVVCLFLSTFWLFLFTFGLVKGS